MLQETIKIAKANSASPDFSKLVVAVQAMSPYDWCDVVVGFPGLSNVKQRVAVGDAVLYETTHDGILEVRASAIHGTAADFTVTQISPRSGFSAGLLTDDPNNSSFSEEEKNRIGKSIDEIKLNIAASGQHSEERLSLIYRKLDEIQDAAGRLGRKDWINYVAGSLTGLCISAAFSPEITKTFLKTVNSGFSWLFTNAPVLLQF